ncbi:hypothetical protein C6T69_05590 [Burkholderia multivorans]|nr:hypothetical protein C6T69_05590 [Burkholderia multivorans]
MEPTMTSKLTERQRMDLLLVADDMSVSGDAALADALRALLAPTQQPSGEVTFERWRDSMSVNWWGNVTPIQAAAAAFNAARAQGGES